MFVDPSLSVCLSVCLSICGWGCRWVLIVVRVVVVVCCCVWIHYLFVFASSLLQYFEFFSLGRMMAHLFRVMILGVEINSKNWSCSVNMRILPIPSRCSLFEFLDVLSCLIQW